MHIYFNCCILHIITHQVIYVGNCVRIFVETGSVASSDILLKSENLDQKKCMHFRYT